MQGRDFKIGRSRGEKKKQKGEGGKEEAEGQRRKTGDELMKRSIAEKRLKPCKRYPNASF